MIFARFFTVELSLWELWTVSGRFSLGSNACKLCQASSRAVLSRIENGLGGNFEGPVELLVGSGTGESGSSIGRAEL